MSRLMLLRHARAAWAGSGSRDFDRRLTESGRREARWIAGAMRDLGLLPERVICSTARRAAETWEEMAAIFGPGKIEVIHDESLYDRDAAHYLDLVQQAVEIKALMLVAHNPTLEDLALAMAGSGERERLASLRRGLPTAGLAVIAFEGSLGEAEPGSGRLETFLVPDPVASR